MYYGAMMKRGTQRSVHAIFQIKDSAIPDNMGEQVAVKSGILREQRFQVKCGLGSNKLIQLHLLRRQFAPVA